MPNCLQRISAIKNNEFYENYQHDLKVIIFLFAITRLVFFSILFICEYLLDAHYEFGNVYLTYDGVHYLDIAIDGYTKDAQYAFFPLFPLVIRFFSLFGIAVPGTILFNHLITLIIAFAIYYTGVNLQNKSADVSLAMSSIWLFSPIAVSTCMLYTEALFVFLTLFAYIFYKQEKYISAGIMLGLSAATRNTGSMLFFAIFIIMALKALLKKDGQTIKTILAMYIPGAFISCAYPIFLLIKLGNWHYFIDVQYEQWGRIKSDFFYVLFNDFRLINQDPSSVLFTYVSLASILYIFYIAVKGKKDYELILYLIFSIFAIFSTCRGPEWNNIPSTSYYRYFYGIVSVYLLIDYKTKFKLIFFINIALSIYAMLVYCSGGFLI